MEGDGHAGIPRGDVIQGQNGGEAEAEGLFRVGEVQAVRGGQHDVNRFMVIAFNSGPKIYRGYEEASEIKFLRRTGLANYLCTTSPEKIMVYMRCQKLKIFFGSIDRCFLGSWADCNSWLENVASTAFFFFHRLPEMKAELMEARVRSKEVS